MTDTPKKTVRKIDTLINPIETSEETIDQCLECLLFSGASEFEGTCADLIYALAAERDALKAEVEKLREGPEIKSLEWLGGGGRHYAGDYVIEDVSYGQREVRRLLRAVFGTTYLGDFGGNRPLESAKAAAQADYETRIRAALKGGAE